jgi:hypothetical protein
MSKFKVGDKIAVYTDHKRSVGIIEAVPPIQGLSKDQLYVRIAIPAGHAHLTPNTKQCRLLKKKERRRVWVDPEYLRSDGFFACDGDLPVRTTERADWIEFLEVVKKR